MAFMPDVGFFLWARLSIAMDCRGSFQAEYDIFVIEPQRYRNPADLRERQISAPNSIDQRQRSENFPTTQSSAYSREVV